MKHPTKLIPLLLIGLLDSFSLPAVELVDEAWEVRYMQTPDHRPEWTEQGIIPAYKISSDAPGEITISSDGNPEYRGIVLVGKRIRLDESFATYSGELEVAVKYQSENEAKGRTCGIYCLPLEAEFWDGLPQEPTGELPALIANHDEAWKKRHYGMLELISVRALNDVDTTGWESWQSENLAPLFRPSAGGEVVVAFAFVAPHTGALQEGAFKDFQLIEISEEEKWRRFFNEEIDLSRDDMLPVQEALQRDDLDAAAEAFVEHMRSRKMPVAPVMKGPADEATLKKAREYATGLMALGKNKPIQWRERPNWSDNSPNYEQWTIGTNRHAHWVDLGRAYAATQNPAFAETYIHQIIDFSTRYPFIIGDKLDYLSDGPVVTHGRLDLSLNAGSRIASNWWPAYYYFKDYEGFDTWEQMEVIKAFYDHGDFLMDARVFNPEANWGSWEASALLTNAIMMPELKDSADWYATANERLKVLQESLVYPDGSPKEISVGYHLANARFFGDAILLQQNNGKTPDPSLRETLERMLEAAFYSSRPGYGMVGFGDANWSSSRAALNQADLVELFPEREDFAYFTTLGEEGSPPEFTSWHSDWAGWYVMRSGWGKDEKYLVFDAGPIGTSHFHADKLGIVVQLGERIVLHDTNNYAYDGSPMQHYIRGTWSHNTVVVDDRIQRSYNMFQHLQTSQPLANRWVSNEFIDFADGVYDLQYADQTGMSNVAHRREVIFIKPEFWVVVDHMVPGDELEHNFKALFHIDPGEVTVGETSKSIMTGWDGGGFAVIPADADSVELDVVHGQEEPRLLGWVPGPQPQSKRPSNTGVYEWDASGPSTRVWLLVPREGDVWSVQDFDMTAATEAGGFNLQLTLADGSQVQITREPGTDRFGQGIYRLINGADELVID